MTLLGDCLSSWRTHPLRLGAAALAFWVALLVLMLLGALQNGLNREVRRLARRLGADEFAVAAPADAPGWPVHAIQSLTERLAPSVALAGLAGPIEKTLADGSPAVFVGVCGNPAATRDWSWNPAPPAPAFWRNASHAAWISAPALSAAAPRAIADSDAVAWRVAGTFAPAAPPPGMPADVIWVPAPALCLDASPDAPPPVRLLLARALPPLAPEQALALLERSLPTSTPASDCDWLTPERLRRQLRDAARTLSWSLSAGSVLALALAAVTLGSLLLLGVRERTQEIGLRRALGARPSQIAAMFLLEATALVAIAAAAAVPTLWLLLPLLRTALAVPLDASPATVLLPALVALAAALLSALPPALRAARLPPLAALRAP